MDGIDPAPEYSQVVVTRNFLATDPVRLFFTGGAQ